MADNVNVTAGDGTIVVAADVVGGVAYQRVKPVIGADGTVTDVSAGAGAVGIGVQRMTLASDDPLVASAGLVGSGPAQYTLADRLRTVRRLLVAAATTLTRPANTTPYTNLDSISDNATAGSVTALPVTFSGYNDDPVTVERIRVISNDTGLGGKLIAVWVYNSDPTASSGVAAGDNAAFSNKKTGFVGRMSGTFRAFSDGAGAVLVPDEGDRIITTPGSGAKTLWIQYQTLADFTPSANSTTLIATLEGTQGVA